MQMDPVVHFEMPYKDKERLVKFYHAAFGWQMNNLGPGGKVLGEPMEIPGIGQYAAITDTEGNRVGLLQPKEM